MKKFILICSVFLAFNAAAAQDVVKPENVDYLRGVLHYIYQWTLDPAHFFEQDQDKDLEIMIKKIDYRKDKDNYSQRYNLIIPDLNLGVDLVKANYRIEELGLQVTNSSFKIVAVYPNIREPKTNEGFSVKILKENRIFSELLKTRNKKSPPSENIMKKLRKSLANLVKIEPKNDLDTDVVTSLEEVSGSNAYITKTWAGRIMYNCIVDGSKIVLHPSSNNNN